jgi:hypothetical protein
VRHSCQTEPSARLAQLVEHFTCNEKVFGSSPKAGSAKVLLIGFFAVIPPGNDPHPAKIVDIVMMGILPRRERTEPELAQLCSASRLRLNRVIPTLSMLAIAEALPV